MPGLSDADVFGSAPIAPPPAPPPLSPHGAGGGPITVDNGRGITVSIGGFGAPQEAPPQAAAPAAMAPEGLSDADVFGAPPPAAQPTPQPTPNDPISQIGGFMANLNRGLGLGDEVAAGLGTVRDLATGAARFGTDQPGNVLVNNLKMLGDTYGLEMAKQRQAEDGFNLGHPHIAAASRGAGMALPLLFSGGAAAPELAAGRLSAIGQGATTGGLAAYGYGLTDRGSPMERLAAANKAILPGMALGGALGFLTPTVGPKASENAPTLADHALVGVDPIPAVNGTQDLQRVGQILKGIPVAGAPLAKAAERTAGQLDTGVQRIGATLGQAKNPLEGGVALQKGAQGGVDFYKGATDEIYKPVNELEANQTLIPVTKTQSDIADMFAKYPNIPGWLAKKAPALADVQKTLQGAGGKLTFGELKAMRGDIGKMIDGDLTIGGIDQARLKQVYGAMSDDLSAGAEQLGGPQARQALSRADTYNAAVRTRVKDTLDKVLQAKSPEDAYSKVLAMAGSNSRGDIQQLGRLKRSMEPEVWNEFASGVVHELGRDPSGNFSAAKFATAWNKMRPEGKRALFGEQVADLDAASRIATMQTSAGKFYNHSGSGSHMLTGMLVAGPVEEALRATMGGHPGEAVASLAGSAAIAALGNGASRLLASPGIGRALMTAQANPTIAPQIMEAYAANNPQVAALARTFGARLQAGLSRGVAGVAASVPSQQPR